MPQPTRRAAEPPAPQTTDEPVIVATDLRKSYGDVQAVAGLSFTVRAGQVVGLLGPNGAGKSTTVNMLATRTAVGGGTATIGGYDVATEPDLVRRLIGLAGQSAAVDEKLTARENLELFGRLYKIPRAQRRRRVAELIERFDLTEFADRLAGACSGGQRRRLDVVAALVADPPALFLDEPTTGLDPRSRAELWDAVEALAASGTAIVLTTQYLEEADRLADDVLIIDHGRVIASGSPTSLKRELEADVLEVRVGPERLDAALAVVAGTGAETTTDAETGTLGVRVGDEVDRALDLLRRIQDAGVAVHDFQLRRPTLDDVFLSLTGRPAERVEES
jgi:ABC-2 type transport system ATP-binding protein